jgi:hypothetical protein
MAKSLDIIQAEKEDKEPIFESKQETETIIEEPKESGGIFYLVLGIVAIVLAVAISLYILFRDNDESVDTSAVSESITATEEATETQSEMVVVSPSPVISEEAAVLEGSVRIANGNGITGEGKRISDLLKTKGYTIDLVNNASKNYTETIIYYKTGKESLAESLKEAISEEYTATIQKSDTIAGIYDAVIALGSK